MTLNSRPGVSASSIEPTKAVPGEQHKDQKTQPQKDDATQKQAQNDPNKQRTPQ
jgi:hypothetical protein